eukprot:6226757-Pyramimonas_sp.AAC.1
MEETVNQPASVAPADLTAFGRPLPCPREESRLRGTRVGAAVEKFDWMQLDKHSSKRQRRQI